VFNAFQHYRVVAISLTLGVVVIWAGALSITAARERGAGKPEKLRHKWWQELARMFAFVTATMAQLLLEVWKVCGETARHLWTVAAGCFRVFALIISAALLAMPLRLLGETTAYIWRNDSFWIRDPRMVLSMTEAVVLAWLSCWAMVLIAAVRDKRNGGYCSG